MLLPDLIARAVRDPMTQGNPGEMHRLLELVEALPGRLGTSQNAVRALIADVAHALRDSLRQARERQGAEELQRLVRRHGGLEPDAGAVDALLSTAQRHALDDQAAADTGLDPARVAEALPLLVPLVLKLLDTGGPCRPGDQHPNAVLDAFLGEDAVDVGEAVRLLAATYAARRACEGPVRLPGLLMYP